MATVILFIYLNYMRQTGYDISVMDWVCLFGVGALQVVGWVIRTGILSYRIPASDDAKPKRLDEWFRD